MTERRRAALRIASNYFRLLATFLLGLYLIRILLRVIGDEGVGLVALLGSTTGIGLVLEEIASLSMVRELGSAHHSGDPRHFRSMYNSAIAVCAAASLAILPLFAGLVIAVPYLNITEELIGPARWFTVAKAIEASVILLLVPAFNMYLVTERMVAHNFWLVARRSTLLLAALVVIGVSATDDVGRIVMLLGWISAGIKIVVVVTAVVIIVARDQRLRPRPRACAKADVLAIISISGWNGALLGARMMALISSAVLMNLLFGLAFNMIFGIAIQLAGYARMLTSGMTAGLDAVATRIASTRRHGSIGQLMMTATRLHGFVAFPAVLFVGLLAEPLLDVWVGSRVEGVHAVKHAALLTRIMLVGLGVMCIADGWLRILYGAGFVRRYAIPIIGGYIASPIVSLLLVMVFPEHVKFAAIPTGYALTFVVMQMGYLPRLMGRLLESSANQVLAPLGRPLWTALLCMPVLLVWMSTVAEWSLLLVALAAASYGVTYAVAGWLIIPTPEERRLLRSMLAGRLMARGRPLPAGLDGPSGMDIDEQSLPVDPDPKSASVQSDDM